MPGNQCQIIGEHGKIRKRHLDSLRGKQPSTLVQILVPKDLVQVQLHSHPACQVWLSSVTHTQLSKMLQTSHYLGMGKLRH